MAADSSMEGEEEAVDGEVVERVAVYQPGFDALHALLKHAAVATFGADKFGELAGVVLAAAFRLALRLKPLVSEVTVSSAGMPAYASDEGVSISAAAVAKEVNRASAVRDGGTLTSHEAMADTDVLRWLQDMLLSQDRLVHRVTAGTYMIKIKNAVRSMQALAMQGAMTEKFGRDSARIIRVLMEHKHLEDKQVGEYAMIPVKDARERLYAMMRSGYLVLREVQKRADYTPMHTYFMWIVVRYRC